MYKMKKSLKVILFIVTVILVLAFVAGLIINSKLNRLGAEKETQTVIADGSAFEENGAEVPEGLEFSMPDMLIPENRKIVNILLLGTDLRVRDSSDIGRADCNMVVSLNRKTGEIKLISFERGIYVPVPAELMPDGSNTDILTHAYHWGGPELSEKIMSECFNIKLLGYVQADFEAFEKAVDAVGGVDIELTETESNALNGYVYTNTNPLDRVVSPGLNHLNGYETLQYCRLRYTDDDWHRQERQRTAIKALAAGVKGLNAKELNSLFNEVIGMVNTDIPKKDLAGLIVYAPKFLGKDIQSLQVPDKNWLNGYIECDFSYESKKISNFVYGTNYKLECPYKNPA